MPGPHAHVVRWAIQLDRLLKGGGVFVNLDDETLSRSSEVGVLAHRGIGQLLTAGAPPDSSVILEVAKSLVSEFPQIESRAHAQLVAGAISSYFTNHLPSGNWMFAGHELQLGSGRIDLLWTTFNDRKMLDEIKTGASRKLLLTRTRDQMERYREAAVAAWGPDFVGIRLISTTDPRKSRLIRPDGSNCSLASASFLKDL